MRPLRRILLGLGIVAAHWGRTENGMTVAWPPGYRLAVEDGEPVVRGSGRTVRTGEPVRMGGGYYETEPLPDMLSAAADTGCPMPFFLSTGRAD